MILPQVPEPVHGVLAYGSDENNDGTGGHYWVYTIAGSAYPYFIYKFGPVAHLVVGLRVLSHKHYQSGIGFVVFRAHLRRWLGKVAYSSTMVSWEEFLTRSFTTRVDPVISLIGFSVILGDILYPFLGKSVRVAI